MRARNTFVEGRRRVAVAGCHHPTASPPHRAVSRNRRRARTSTTTLTDFCNRRKARAHWRNDRCPALRRFSRVERCALRRSGDAKIAPTVLAPSQRRARHGSRLWYQNQTSQSPAPAPTHWRVTGCSGASLGPPRVRRANGRAFGNEPGCLSLHEIRPFLFEPDWPGWASLRPLRPRLLSPGMGADR
jgi:hypothetical protein